MGQITSPSRMPLHDRQTGGRASCLMLTHILRAGSPAISATRASFIVFSGQRTAVGGGAALLLPCHQDHLSHNAQARNGDSSNIKMVLGGNGKQTSAWHLVVTATTAAGPWTQTWSLVAA